jgi:ribosome-associated protein
MIEITDTIALDEGELDITFIHASGPGGQNVNKLYSAAQLRFDARQSPSLPPDVAARLERLAGKRATNEGVIVITAKRFRTQERNRADAVARLSALIAKAAVIPKPRRRSRPSRAQKQLRLQDKARRADRKSMRARPASTE